MASGYILVASLVLGVLIGMGIDAARGSESTWTVVCACVGLVVGLYHVVKDAL